MHNYECDRVANAMFAAIHLNNMLGTDTPREEVYLQCLMAFVLGALIRMPLIFSDLTEAFAHSGWYYALRLQRGGSLWETVFMHAVNNSLALIFDAALVEDRGSLLLGVAATIGKVELSTFERAAPRLLFCRQNSKLLAGSEQDV